MEDGIGAAHVTRPHSRTQLLVRTSLLVHEAPAGARFARVLVAGVSWSAVGDTTLCIADDCSISWSATTSNGSMSCCARERTTAPSAPATRKVTKRSAAERRTPTDKQLAVVAELTRLVAEAAGDPGIAERTWVLLTEAPDGGWGLHGHAHTNSELVAAARVDIAALSTASGG